MVTQDSAQEPRQGVDAILGNTSSATRPGAWGPRGLGQMVHLFQAFLLHRIVESRLAAPEDRSSFIVPPFTLERTLLRHRPGFRSLGGRPTGTTWTGDPVLLPFRIRALAWQHRERLPDQAQQAEERCG